MESAGGGGGGGAGGGGARVGGAWRGNGLRLTPSAPEEGSDVSCMAIVHRTYAMLNPKVHLEKGTLVFGCV